MVSERVNLTMAICEYDHVADLASERVGVEGVDLRCLNLPLEEIFYRFIKFREWDVSEMSYGKYVSLVSQGDTSMTAIPVFPSRMHRFSSMYVRADGPTDISQLRGMKIGIPEWAQTAAVYTRGILHHDFGIGLDEVQWFQAGINDRGRQEKVDIRWPEGVSYTSRPDSTLDELLLTGEIDAAFCARAPASVVRGDTRLRRLYPDYRRVEQEYWERTGVYPIMHAIVIRREVLDAHPWVARNLQTAFEAARDNSVDRLFDITASRFPLPWAVDTAEGIRGLFGGTYWPYGVDENWQTLDTFLEYAYEQGVAHRRVAVEELFPASVQSRYRV